MKSLYDTVAIVGPGLIGGSIGMGLLQHGLARRVIGIGRRQTSLQEALDVGAVDEVTLDPAKGVAEANLVVLATPIRALTELAPVVAGAMPSGAVLTEVASTKRSVIDTITNGMGSRDDLTFIPTHPMAGSEQRGAPHATANLFDDSVCIFTPLPDTPESALADLQQLWEGLGAMVHHMSPVEHDRTVASVSHLPHLAAACLARHVSENEGRFAGGGFVDTTRVASGDPRLWRDICESNADEISDAVHALMGELQQLQEMFAREDFEAIQTFLHEAKDRRDRILAGLARHTSEE